MAANVQKYKVANMAKDLDKKTKEIVEVLKEKGFDGTTSSSVLENFEINIVLEHYASASTVDDIGAYLSSKKPEEKPAEAAPKAEVKEEPKAPEVKPEPEKTETKKEEAVPEVKKEEEAPAEPPAPPAPSAEEVLLTEIRDLLKDK